MCVRVVFLVAFFAVLGTRLARAAELPTECSSAVSAAKPVDRTSTVYYDRAYFFSVPKMCPISDMRDPHPHLKDCPWRRKAYVVHGDVVREVAQTDRFVCATFHGTTGWIPTMDLCLSPKSRRSRRDPFEYEDDSHIPCGETAARTIQSEQIFFAGAFESDNAELKTEYVSPHTVRYAVTLADSGCHETVAGKADANGAVATDRDGTSLSFNEAGVDLRLGERSRCPGFEKEFFFDPGGTVLAIDWPPSGGCDLDVPGLEKRNVVQLYYALKSAVARDDRGAFAAMVQYPMTPTMQGRKTLKIRGAAEFVARYDSIVNSCMKADLRADRIGRLFCRDQGLMLAGGEIWINGDASDPKIVALNVPACSASPSAASKVEGAHSQ